MAYIGNQPLTSTVTIDSQSLTGNGTAGPYTLSHAVISEEEIEVFVNFVRQRPGVAYTVAGNQLTMTGAVASTDDFYVVFQGKAMQTLSIKHTAGLALDASTGTFSGDITTTGAVTATGTVTSDGIGCVSHSEHFIFTQSDNAQYYPNWMATPYNWKANNFTYSNYGTITGSGVMPDGKTILNAIQAFGNPGATGMAIYTLGNVGQGNAGWNTVQWSNHSGSDGGSANRTDCSYTNENLSSTTQRGRYWQISNHTTFTGTNPRTIAGQGFIKLTFV